MKPQKRTVDIRNDCVAERQGEAIPWIWDGVIAEDAVTLLSAPEKTGKTTLLSLLLDRRRSGGRLLGRWVRPGRTILCSEEHDRLWALRQPPLDFGHQLQYCRPMSDPPTRRDWRQFIDYLLGAEFGLIERFDLLVIDTVMSFLPPVQRNPRALREALEDFRLLAGTRIGVLLLHQTRRTHSRPLAAFADILIDMEMPKGERFTRRRQFRGVGRYPGTLQHVAAELNPEGTDYILLDAPSAPVAPPPSTMEMIVLILGESPTPLARPDILARWPTGQPAPRPDSLWRTLTRGCELGLFTRSGSGTKTESFRYGLKRNGTDAEQTSTP